MQVKNRPAVKSCRVRVAHVLAAAALATVGNTAPVSADGVFFQSDISDTTANGVFVFAREPLSFGLNHVRYDGGNRSTANLLYRLPLPENAPIVRLGPSYGVVEQDNAPSDSEFGAKASIEKWMPTDFGSIYLLAEVNSIDRARFALTQVGLSKPALQFELSYGESDSYQETSVALSARLGGGPINLRTGYRLDSEEFFIGLSINTF